MSNKIIKSEGLCYRFVSLKSVSRGILVKPTASLGIILESLGFCDRLSLPLCVCNFVCAFSSYSTYFIISLNLIGP